MPDKKRWVYGRGDDRFMDQDRLDDTAANISSERHPAGRSCGTDIALGLTVIGLVSWLVVSR